MCLSRVVDGLSDSSSLGSLGQFALSGRSDRSDLDANSNPQLLGAGIRTVADLNAASDIYPPRACGGRMSRTTRCECIPSH